MNGLGFGYLRMTSTLRITHVCNFSFHSMFIFCLFIMDDCFCRLLPAIRRINLGNDFLPVVSFILALGCSTRLNRLLHVLLGYDRYHSYAEAIIFFAWFCSRSEFCKIFSFFRVELARLSRHK